MQEASGGHSCDPLSLNPIPDEVSLTRWVIFLLLGLPAQLSCPDTGAAVTVPMQAVKAGEHCYYVPRYTLAFVPMDSRIT